MYFKIITEYKWILKAKKAESFQAEIKASFFSHISRCFCRFAETYKATCLVVLFCY